jgi:hypothetical protein
MYVQIGVCGWECYPEVETLLDHVDDLAQSLQDIAPGIGVDVDPYACGSMIVYEDEDEELDEDTEDLLLIAVDEWLTYDLPLLVPEDLMEKWLAQQEDIFE